MFGARAVQRAIIEGFPDIPLSISVVWIKMLALDNKTAASQAARSLLDRRVCHFYDPQRLVGEIIGKTLLMPQAGPAWDIYMLFEPNIEWTNQAPHPFDWVHQLSGGKRADPARYRQGEELIKALHSSVKRLTGISSP